MKKCTYCGKEYSDEMTVCPIDHQSLTLDGLVAAAPPPRQPSATPSGPLLKPALMVKLRSLHLYLGCIFAPMLLFFAISGIWQTLGFTHAPMLKALSTIHMVPKAHGSLASPLLKIFNIIMALAFITTTILGIVMALKYGRRRAAVYCLAFGVAFPLLLVLLVLIRLY